MVVCRGKSVYTNVEIDNMMKDVNSKISQMEKTLDYLRRELKRQLATIDKVQIKTEDPIKNGKRTIGDRLRSLLTNAKRLLKIK